MMYRALLNILALLRLLLLKHLVDGLIEDSGIAVDVDAFVIQLAGHLVEPAVAVGLLVDEGDILLQRRVDADEFARAKAINIGDGFEAFDPAENLPRLNCHTRLGFKVVVDHVSEHARGKLGESHPPSPAFPFTRPKV